MVKQKRYHQSNYAVRNQQAGMKKSAALRFAKRLIHCATLYLHHAPFSARNRGNFLSDIVLGGSSCRGVCVIASSCR